MSNNRACRLLAALVVFALLAPGPRLSSTYAAPPTPGAYRLSAAWAMPAGLSTPDPAPPADQPQTLPFPTPATWTAGESWVTQLSPAQQRALLGVPVEAIAAEHQQAMAYLSSPEAALTAHSYPPYVDWRHAGGHDWTTSVKNQGTCNSCAAFATVAAIESRMEIRDNNPDENPDLSEAHMYFCNGRQCNLGDPNVGWSLYDALNAAQWGIATERCYPYVGSNQSCRVCSDWTAQATKINTWYGAFGPDEIKEAVASGGPVVVDFVITTGFYWYRAGIYRNTSGLAAGGHAVTIVGYNDCGGYWIVKNSWGAGWGEGGFFRMAYGDEDFEDFGYVPELQTPKETGCDPDSDQVTLYSEQNYQGVCKVLRVGEYASWYDLLPVGNDNTLSIRVGDRVTATLYQHIDFEGLAEAFTSDDADLLDNTIGSITSSVRVERRGDASTEYDRRCLYLPVLRH